MEKTWKKPGVRTLTADLLLAAIVVGLFVSLSVLGGGMKALPASASVFRRGAVYKGTERKKVALCCTAGWNASAIEKMLDTLEKNGVKITFAIGPDTAGNAPETVQKIVRAGHEIAVLAGENTKNVKTEAEKTLRMLENLGAPRPKLLVFTGDNTAAGRAAAELRLTAVAGTKEFITLRGSAEQIARRAAGNTSGGDIVFCAPTAAFAEALPSILEYYSAMGLTTSTVSGTIYD